MTLTHTRNVVHPHIAKSGSAWTDADLRLCNVNIVDVDIASFFGIQELPTPSVSPAVLNSKVSYPQQPQPSYTHTALTNEERLFFHYLQAAMDPGPDQDAAVVDFTLHLLHLLGFTQPNPSKQHPEEAGGERRVLRRNYDLPLFMCGRTVHAIADICLLVPSARMHHGDTVLLLAKASPTTITTSSASSTSASAAEAQLFAQAIAAFQCQNRARRRAHLAPVETQVVPAFIMAGTAPVLYKIEITAGLVECVQTAQVPPKVTSVLRLELPVERPEAARMEGMAPLDNRKVMLACLEAFKALV
ncbi:hypothetical protein D9615_008483 [Tricholomella constricta]|uniref:Uncharacterized protein n=1 Tax=Tricholomella constricta TaxID=117010 RepID=A0A8H5H456_9AGAR|nr:hypothetical protein D9615_008483 [Tricholomella constricta]